MAVVLLGPLGLEGDAQRHPLIHGGPERAICLYSVEVIERLRSEGHPLEPGAAGENLTIEGIDFARLGPGHRLRLGAEAEVEITSFVTPCRTIAGAFLGGDSGRIDVRRHPGDARLYARVITAGVLRVGDRVEVARDSADGVAVAELGDDG